MKSVMISIQPKWVELIANGQKTIEVRKTRPKLDTPFKCYIYCTFPKKPVYTLWLNRGKENRFLADGKVIGHFVCDRITKLDFITLRGSIKSKDLIKNACLNIDEMKQYIGTKNGYAWHITDLVIYDEPKELGEFAQSCNYKGLCFSCKRANFDNIGNIECNNKLTRPPQSWCYVEEKE